MLQILDDDDPCSGSLGLTRVTGVWSPLITTPVLGPGSEVVSGPGRHEPSLTLVTGEEDTGAGEEGGAGLMKGEVANLGVLGASPSMELESSSLVLGFDSEDV